MRGDGAVFVRDALLNAVVRSTHVLLSGTDYEHSIQQALALLGHASGADYACIFENHVHPQTGVRLISKRFEWVNEGVPSQMDNPALQDLPYHPTLTRFYKQLERGDPLHGLTDQLLDIERPLLESLGIRSLLIIPIFVRRAFWGFLGLTDLRFARTWVAQDIAIVQNAASSLGGALDRRYQEEQLIARDRLLQGVSRATNNLLSAPTVEDGIQLALQALGQAAMVERAYIFENVVDEKTGQSLMHGRYVWTHPKLDFAIDMERLQNLSYEALFPRWYEVLASGRTISGRVTDFLQAPTRLGEGVMLRTMLLVPIMMENQFWGFLGFDDSDLERTWLPADESILHAVAGSLGAAMARQRAEEALRQSEERFRQAQKMEAIGRLAGGVAHDFNNLLTAIMGYGELMLNQLKADDNLHHEVQEICKAADRAHSLTRQLLAFSRKQVLEPKVVNLNESVSELEKLLRRLIGEDVSMETELDHDIAMVKVDPGQIEQVIINLAVNARDAMPDGGRLILRTYNADIVKRVTRGHAFVEPGRYVALSITDTGQGMDEFVQARIFEPFFTTKEVGKGTGLGLSMIYGIVQQSNGYIMFESEPDKGTRFTIYLPQVELPTLPSRAANRADSAGGTETILLVEDEEVVRHLSVRILKDQGYHVLSATNGLEAYTLLQENKEPINLILTDIVMPQMSGRALAERVKVSHPHLKVLYMSGYAAEETMGSETDLANFIQKPFTPSALNRKVREVLDAR